MPKQHLVKKSKEYVDQGLVTPGKGKTYYCETKINGAPSGHKLAVGDTVYVAEAGYAIIAKGSVTDVYIQKIYSLEELFTYVNRSNIRGEKYWFRIAMGKIFNNPKFESLSIMEYAIESNPLKCPVPLGEEFSHQSSWYYLPDNFVLPRIPRSLDLSSEIPASLRYQIYYKWMVGKKSCFVDIDHFVPKSVGGPGNIEENLHLVGLSINRRKSNSIPAGLFVIADRNQMLAKNFSGYARKSQKLFNANETPFFTDSESKRVAKDIVTEVNSQSLEKVRQFYLEVKKLHMET